MSKKSIIKYGASLLLSAGLLLNLGSLEVLATESTETVEKNPKYFSFPEEGLSRKSAFFQQATLGTMRSGAQAVVPTFVRDESTEEHIEYVNGYMFEKFDKSTGERIAFDGNDIITGDTNTAGLTITMGSDDYLYISKDTRGEVDDQYFNDSKQRGQLSFDVKSSNINVVLDNLDIAALNSEFEAEDREAAGVVIYSTSASNKEVSVYLVGENKIKTSAYAVDLKHGVDVNFHEAETGKGTLTMTTGSNGIRVLNGSSINMNSGTVNITAATSYGISMPDEGKLTMNGGNLSVFSAGSFGIALTGTAELEMNGGELRAEGTLGVCRVGVDEHKFVMNGGTAVVKGNTGVAVNVAFGTLELNGGILSLESGITTDVYAGNFVATQGNAVLIKRGYVEHLDYEDPDTNLLVVDMSSGQTDPYHYYYGGSSIATPTEDSTETYYGRVVGNVQLLEDFTIENNVIVDIPPENTLRHNPSKDDSTSYLSINKEGTLRFQGVYPASGAMEEENAPFLWNKGRATPTSGDEGYGTFWLVLTDELIGDSNGSGIVDGYMEYDGGTETFGQITIAEAGLGTFWNSGYLSVTYTGENTESAASKDPIYAGKFTVRVQEMGSRSIGPTGTFEIGIDQDYYLAFSAPGQAFNYFEVAPYNLAVDSLGDSRTLTVTVTDEDALELDPAGNLTTAAQALVKVTSPFDDSETLTLGTDYQISTIAEELDIASDGTMSREFTIQIIGIGNYTGIYVDDTKHAANQDAGLLGDTQVYIEGVGEVYIKPDGTIDLSEVEIISVDGTVLEIDNLEKYITDIAVNEDGELLYRVRIEEANSEISVDPDEGVLIFTITAKRAGTGNTFSQGQLNLVSTFYERPDGKVYAEDLILTDATGTLKYGEDYTLEYWDSTAKEGAGGFVTWEKWVDSDTPTLDDVDRTENFTVRAINKDNNKTDDDVEFNVVWEKGGSVYGYDFSKGILSSYDTTTMDKIYVAKYYGVVTSAQGLGLEVSSFEVVASDDDTTADEWKEVEYDLDDQFIDYVLSYAEFEAYVDAVTNGNPANKTQIVSNLNLDGNTGEENEDYTTATGKQWYITLQGTSPYNGQLFFEVPADKIEFIHIAEDVEGVLNNYLILDPNKYPNTNVYQKPDGTLHEADVQLYHRLTVLDANNQVQSVPLTVTAYQMTMEEVTVENPTEGVVVYQLDIKDTTSSSTPLKELDSDAAAEVFFDALEAGTGDTFRHGKIDRLEESYTIDYVGPSSLEEDGSFTYTEADRDKIMKQIPFYHNGNLLEYGSDYTSTITMEGDLIEHGIFTFTVTGTGDSETKGNDGTSVTFNVTIAMNFGTLSFDQNGGGALTEADYPAIQPATMDETIDLTQLNVPTKTGYTFQGWALDEEGHYPLSAITDTLNMTSIVTYATEEGVEFTDNVFTLYAIWEADAETYTVKFDATGDESGNSFSDIPSLEATHTITIPTSPTPTRTGYKFDGWALSADGTKALPTTSPLKVQDILDVADYSPTGTTITLYAQWTAVYSVVFDGNGGELNASTTTQSGLTKDQSFTLPVDATNPTRDGFKFAGWKLGDTDITTNTIASLIEIDDTTHNFTLYAQWEAVYTVSFDGNLGTWSGSTPADVTGTESDQITFPTTANEPTRTGYTFDGWAMKSTGGAKVTTGSTVEALLTAAAAASVEIAYQEIIIYAQWKANEYTVSFFDSAEAGAASSTAKSSNHIALVDFPVNPSPDKGYIFKGWSKSSGDSTLLDVDETTYADLATTVDGENNYQYTGSVYAVWEKMEDKHVYFDYNYDGKGFLASVASTETVEFPTTDTSRDGYEFLGWSFEKTGGDLMGDADLNKLVYDHDYSFTVGDVTTTIEVEMIYAQWKELEYTITFEPSGGTATDESSLTSKVGFLEGIQFPDVTKSGATLDGWFYNGTRVEEGISLSQLNHGVDETTATITARWTDDPVATATLTYNYGDGTTSPSTTTHPITTDVITLAAEPTYTDHTFEGWKLNDNKTYDAEVTTTMAELVSLAGTNDVVLTAQWKEVETGGDGGEDPTPTVYKVHFDGNGKTLTGYDSIELTEGKDTSFTIPSNPSSNGFVFNGWSLEKNPDASAKIYVANEEVLMSSVTFSDNAITLYAQWTEAPSDPAPSDPAPSDPDVNYTVSFNWNYENKGEYDSATSTSSSATVSLPTAPNRSDYEFLGWTKTSSDTDTTYVSSGTSFAALTSKVSDTEYSGTLYAQWKLVETTPEDPQDPVIVTYTVTYDYNFDGNGTYTTKNSKTATDKLTHPSNPTRTGYTFEGWYTESTCKTAVLTNSKTYSELATTKVDEENYKGTLYANWTKVEDSGTEDPTITYMVNFYQNYGTAGILSSKTSTLGSASVVFPSNPTRTNYSFDGWSTSSSGGSIITSGTFAQLTTAVSTSYYTGDLYAQWTYTGGSSGGTDSDSGSNDSGSNDSGSNDSGSNDSGSSDSGSNDSGSNDSSSNNSNSNAGSTEPDISVNNDVAGDRLTVDLLLKPSVSGTQLNTTVTEDAMSEALSQAGNNKDYDVTITPDYSGTTSNKDYDFTLDRGALEAFANSNAATLTVIRDDVIITFDKSAVDHILYNTLNAVIVSVDNKNLSSTASAAFGSRPSYDVSITDSVGTALANLGDGVMKITLPFTPTASELAGNLIAGRVNYYGDIEYQIKSYFDGAGMLILTDKLGVYGITNRENTSALTNLDNHWSEEYARFTDARRLYAEINNVNLNDEITRADFVTIVGIIQGIDVSKQGNPDFFHDVSSSAYYAPYVQWALENNVSAGKLDGYFDPDAAINREEMAAMLLAYIRSMNKELEVINGQKKFTDEDAISKWAEDAVQYVQTLGLIFGKDDDYFDPQGLTTFGDHAVMMMRLIESIVNIHTVFID